MELFKGAWFTVKSDISVMSSTMGIVVYVLRFIMVKIDGKECEWLCGNSANGIMATGYGKQTDGMLPS